MLDTPSPFFAIGPWYDDFSQTTDEEVCRLLDESRIGVGPATFPRDNDAVISADRCVFPGIS